MTTIKVWLKDSLSPLIFDAVEEYYDTRKTLEIIQDELYKTTRTKIFKEHIIRYAVHEKRC